MPRHSRGSTMSDSFARAQARRDNSEHPDFYADDKAEYFHEALTEECAKQLSECHEMSIEFLCERLRPDAITLMSDPAAFVAKCKTLIAEGEKEFLPSLIDSAYHIADRTEGLSAPDLASEAIKKLIA